MSLDPIPLVDVAAQHAAVAAEVERGFARVMTAGSFVLGEDVRLFEEEFASFCGVTHCVGVANGTDALEIGLRAIGVHPGSEVIIPANTFVATAEAVARIGAEVRFADCDPATLLVDPNDVVARISRRTKAIVAVHLYGQVAPMAELASIAEGSGIALVEDAAQAHGATYGGRVAGSLGVFAATSFYPGKNLGAYGDAGAVLTNEDEVARRVRAIRNHGGVSRYEHEELGFNSRLDTLQAVVLRAKLHLLPAWNEHRRRAAAHYDDLFRDIASVTRPVTAAGNEHVWHLYVVQLDQRERVLAALRRAGVEAGIHYPVPVHLLPPFRDQGSVEGSAPVAERAAGRILSLPIFPGITDAQQHRVAEAIAKARP